MQTMVATSGYMLSPGRQGSRHPLSPLHPYPGRSPPTRPPSSIPWQGSTHSAPFIHTMAGVHPLSPLHPYPGRGPPIRPPSSIPWQGSTHSAPFIHTPAGVHPLGPLHPYPGRGPTNSAPFIHTLSGVQAPTQPTSSIPRQGSTQSAPFIHTLAGVQTLSSLHPYPGRGPPFTRAMPGCMCSEGDTRPSLSRPWTLTHSPSPAGMCPWRV